MKSDFSASKRVLQKYKNRTQDALRLSGEYVAGQVKLLTVVDTGMLRGSITYALKNFQSKVDTTTNMKQNRKAIKPNKVTQQNAVSKPVQTLVCRIGTNVEYAPYVEAKKSFLRTGLKLSQSGIKYIFGRI